MGVSKKDREAYDRGKKDRDRSVLEIVTQHIVNPPPADNPAYEKGQKGEQLDADKKEK